MAASSSTFAGGPKAFPTVLQVIPTLETGGAERTTIDVAAAIVAAGGRALVATAGGRLVDELRATGAEPLLLPVQSKNPLTILANARRLAAICRAEAVDILHARSRAPAWSALLAARRAGIAFVTTYHGAYRQAGTLKALYNSSMTRADAIIANSAWTRELILAREPRAAGRVRVIHRGTDFAGFNRAAIAPDRIAALRAAWGVPADARLIVNLARVTRWKGQLELVDAVRRLAIAPRFADVRLVLAGDAQGRDGYVAEVEAAIAAAGLADRARLVGHCADPAAAMATADVAVVASIEPEAFGRAAVEAQALETPVVVTDLGAVGETVIGAAPGARDMPDAPDARFTGWKVAPGDSSAMADAIAAALDLAPAARAALGARARHHVTTRFSLAAMTGATLALYRELVGGA